MKPMLKFAAISMAVIVNLAAAFAQNASTPKPEDTERNAFETPTAGKATPTTSQGDKDLMPIQKAG